MLSSLFSSCVIFVILFHISHSTSVANKQYTCNLLSNSSDQVICNLPISMNNGFKLASSLASVPLAYENGKLIWLNQYQPANLRWTQLCPRPSQYSIYLCSNGAECHQTGTCVLRFVNAMRNEQVQINLIDNVNNTRLDVPKFNDNQLKMIEITMDLLQLSSEESGEQVLIESIGELDPFHSKLVYERIEFSLILMNKTINSSPFFIEKDAKSDKLVLKASRLYFDMLKSNRSALTCLIYELRMRRPGSEVVDSARIQINLKDARLDRPVFDFSVYNFTIVENSPLSTIIGQVNAVFLNAEDESLMKYRIVPFVDDFKMFQSQSESNEIDSLSLASSSLLPIKIDSTTGQLTQRVFVDREKFLNGGEPGSGKLASSDDGVISFNVEVSYASMLYDYCKVNVFVRDVNDNPPLIRIKPLHNFDRPTNNGLKSHYIKNSTAWLSPITNLYVSDQTPASQILAYISVLDQDSGENGTVKAVDLSLLNVKQPSQQLVKQRQLKLQRLRDFEIRSNQSHVASLESPATSQSIHTIPLPVRLNKISNKLYTLQLVEKLNFKHFESYSIEMRVQDNGSRPQLEGKQRIDLNILDYNRHAPIFLNSNNKVELPELSPRQFNATCIFRFDAIDLDDERSGHVKYKIVNNPFLKLLLNTKQLDDRDFNIEATSLLESTFKLNKETGELVLLKPIDRDTLLNDTIELQVMAQDQSEPSQTRKYTTFSLLISIIDSNNQRPRFEGVENNALNLAYSIENNKERFVRLTSDIYLIDSDKSDTNSVRFLEAVSNETNQFLSSPSTQHVSSLIDSKVFKFGDLSCYKSFNIRLTPSTDVNQLPFLVYVTRDTNNSLNNIKCKVSVWLDNQKYPKNETNSEYKLQLTATDNGVDQSYENYDLNKIDIQVSLNNIMPSILKRKVSVQVDLNTKKDKRAYGEIELANMSQSQVDFVKLSACVQLVDVNSELTLVNCSRLFKLLDMRLQYQLDEINEGAYLIDVYRRDENMKLQLVQIELFVYKSMIGLKRARSTALEYELSVINALKSVNNILMQTRSDSIVQESENSIVKAIQNSFSSTLAQFQQLIFGKNPTLQLLSNDGKSASLFTQNESTSTSSSIFSILFTNRSTFMKLVLLTVCFSLAVLILLVCCIFITIQRNNTKSKPKPGVIVNESDKNYSSYNKKFFKSLNVIDDDLNKEKMKEPAGAENDNGGFTQLMASKHLQYHQQRNYKINEVAVEEATSATDKVTHYLNCLDSSISSSDQPKESLNEKNEHSEPVTHTTSSPSSLMDSKKSLIMPVNYLQAKSSPKITTNTSTFGYGGSILKNSTQGITKTNSPPNTQNKSSVCTLSTTSSSCISDEGCYGSSDFSSELDKQHQSSRPKEQPVIVLDPNSIMKNQLVVSKNQTTHKIRNYQNYSVINNFSRFEKIYNNINTSAAQVAVAITDEASSNGFVDSSLSPSSNSNINIITAISGSYV